MTAERAVIMTLTNVEVSFGRGQQPMLGQVSLQVREGEFVSFVGPSGCGKSTLLRLMAGLLEPTSGTLTHLSEKNGRHSTPKIGFVFQHPTLLPWRTAMQNLVLPLELTGSRPDPGHPNPADLSPRRLLALLQQVGLHPADATKRPAALSGGMQMRLSLARALVNDPDLLLLDEPLAAVDDLLRMRLQEDVARVHREQSLTTVLVTHNLIEAVYLSDRVFVLGGTPTRLIAEMEIPFAQPRPADLRTTAGFGDLVRQLSDALLVVSQSPDSVQKAV